VLLKLAPFLFVFLWSTGFIGAKYGLPYADALSFLLVRYFLVIGLMTVLALATRAPWPSDPRRWFHIGVSGVLVHAFYLGGVFVAIGHGLPAGVTALVVGMQPLLTAFGAGAFLGAYRSAFFGPLRSGAVAESDDLTPREFTVALVFGLLIVAAGLWPQGLLEMLRPAAEIWAARLP